MFGLKKKSKVLVIAAHPDDELLGLGGTINRLVTEMDVDARAIILGEGITSRSESRDPERWHDELALHRANIKEAGDIIGFHKISTHSLPDNRFDSVDLLDIVKLVEGGSQSFSQTSSLRITEGI